MKAEATPPTEQLLEAKRAKWFHEFEDITSGVPERLPPLREINHRIPLVDDAMNYRYHLPRCAEAVKPALMEKIQRYTRAHWWKPATVPQAAPMLCIPKKDGGLRTVVDCRRRNDNTVKDVTPFPDQEQIRMDVARAPFRSKIDLSDAYEQIRVEPADVGKTAFATVYGTMLSNVMQQGDCNGPATFQRLMTHVFRDYIGIFVHVYLDDIFIYSDSAEDHERHLRTVFETLRENHLFLKAKKCDLYSTRMDCLGHIIDDEGLHADADKMARVREWRTPRNYHDVQRFLGLVQYLAHFMPDVSAYTGPLSAITRNGHTFDWRPLHQRCFDTIKHLACKAPILKPIDPARAEPIWVICDASTSGVGAFYGQGPAWTNCRPAGFMSRKFTDAQHAYRVFELETLAILEALMKWEDKLLGRKITIVTDHKALEFFKTQSRLSNRQTRWMEFMARFDYDIVYVKGISNKVADSFSRYFASDLPDEVHTTDDYVNVDTRLDPDGEDLPLHRAEELRAMRVGPTEAHVTRPRTRLFTRQQLEARHAEAQQLAADTTAAASVTGVAGTMAEADPTVGTEDKATEAAPLPKALASPSELLEAARAGYTADSTFAKVIQAPKHYATFTVDDGLIYSTNRLGQRVLCLPRTRLGRQSLTGAVISAAHTTIGHFGSRKTSEYVRRWYWWPTLGRDIDKFCASCGICQTVKPSTQMPAGLLHSLPVPTRPWGSIAMDFLGPFPESLEANYLWVVLCRLTSLVHLIPVRTTVSAVELAWVFVRDIVRLHGLPDSIVSDRDSKFTSRFWQEVHRLLGTRLLMSTAFHPQTDGATERANRSISQVLRAVVQPNQKDWANQLPLVEFALNASVSSSTGYAPFELTYGAMPRMAQPNISEKVAPGVRRFAEHAREVLLRAHDAIIDSRVHQTYHANKARRDEDIHHSALTPIAVGDLVYLSTENLALPKGRARKLAPRFIGPYPVVVAHPSTSTYTLELPPDLRRRNIHPTFHVGLLRRHEANDDELFPHRDTKTLYDLGIDPDTEWLVDEILSHRWAGRRPEFLVRWNLGDTTWEPLDECRKLEALDRYLELLGVRTWSALPRRDPDVRSA
ncbi:polyprotein [Phanerochaete sordida]|uniref:Polyprotein n=1 Tax=Phanerochaete sordida TaxID=48140 RepID=A0A9P3LFI1_9APHY|nr:polyprotein [Phanerochaete sordida]